MFLFLHVDRRDYLGRSVDCVCVRVRASESQWC